MRTSGSVPSGGQEWARATARCWPWRWGIGGVIIPVAAVLIATEFWEELGTTGPLAVVAAASLSMLIAGIVVPETAGEHGGRLRAVLWAAATGAFAGFVALLARTR